MHYHFIIIQISKYHLYFTKEKQRTQIHDLFPIKFPFRRDNLFKKHLNRVNIVRWQDYVNS